MRTGTAIKRRALDWLDRLGTSREQRSELARLAASNDTGELEEALAPDRTATLAPQGHGPWIDKLAGVVTRRLHQLDTPEAQNALRRLVQHPEKDVRAAAVNRLADNPGESTSNALLVALDDEDELVRVAAMVGLGEARWGPAVLRIEERLEAGGRLERRVAVDALRKIRG